MTCLICSFVLVAATTGKDTMSSDSTGPEVWEVWELESRTHPQLQKMARERGLKVSGTKNALVKRLHKRPAASETDSDSQSS